MLLKDKKVAIIGAGPVGLTLATLLQQKGVNVTVYERDENRYARIWGSTLDLHRGSGQEALKAAGLLERYFEKAIPTGRNLADQHGEVFFAIAPQVETPEINRNELRNLLLNSLAKGTVIWNRKFTTIDKHNGKWLLHFENQPEQYADIVIGANGGMSGVRKYVTETRVVDTGSFIIQGEVSKPEIECERFYRLCNHNILMAAHGGKLLAANPDNNGLLTYNVIFKRPEEWNHEDYLKLRSKEHARTFLLNRCSHWAGLYKELFSATSAFWVLPTRIAPLDATWDKMRPLPITLIGDAAHLMPPFAGQGVNTGLVDALILSQNLTEGKFESIQAAICDYERQMFVYAKEAQLETIKNERDMHRPDFSFKTRFSS